MTKRERQVLKQIGDLVWRVRERLDKGYVTIGDLGHMADAARQIWGMAEDKGGER